MREHVPGHREVHVFGAGDGGGQIARMGWWGQDVCSAAEDGRLGANRGERGVLVVGPQAWQEPDGGGEGCRGNGRIEQRRQGSAGVLADLEG